MRVYSFDPGQAYGIAICEDGAVTYSAQKSLPQTGRLVYAMQQVAELIRCHGLPDLVTVEQPATLGRGASFDSLAGQWRNVFVWVHAAELAGFSVQWMNPATWRALMIREVKATIGAGEDAKAILQLPQAEMSERALGYAVGNDECSAVWMALWACANADQLTPEARKAAKKVKAGERKAARDRKAAKAGVK